MLINLEMYGKEASPYFIEGGDSWVEFEDIK